MLKNTLIASLAVAWISPPTTKSESTVERFTLDGSAAVLGADCIRLTPDSTWKSGSAWSKTELNLDEPFDLEMNLVFGSKDELGSDGIVFVLSSAPGTGWRGEGIGFLGLRHALGIELDTYANRRQNDPSADHLALVVDGFVGHRGGYETPVELPNLEDGRPHRFRVAWSPIRGELRVFLDGKLRATYPGSIVREVLGEGAVVSWGLTAGTGRKSNAHDVCFES